MTQDCKNPSEEKYAEDLKTHEEIRNSISRTIHESPPIIGREIHIFEEIDSTNIKGMELGDQGSPEGTVILAETQSKGKGRLGRSWISPKGNIYLSVILRPNISPSQAPLITLMGAVACTTALRKALNIPVEIKWPNDIIFEGKKLGGILTEINSEMDRINHVVLGIGINVNMDPSALPSDVKVIATSLKETVGRELPRIEILSAIIKELDKWYKALLSNGSGPVLDEWRRLSPGLGKRVKVESFNRSIDGIAEEIDDYGRLLLRLESGEIEKITSGDVTVIS
jgi:BirA family biotin operon repressor/biotin-[acetyl-CoA-carboxylase] ligase